MIVEVGGAFDDHHASLTLTSTRSPSLSLVDLVSECERKLGRAEVNECEARLSGKN